MAKLMQKLMAGAWESSLESMAKPMQKLMAGAWKSTCIWEELMGKFMAGVWESSLESSSWQAHAKAHAQTHSGSLLDMIHSAITSRIWCRVPRHYLAFVINSHFVPDSQSRSPDSLLKYLERDWSLPQPLHYQGRLNFTRHLTQQLPTFNDYFH